MNRNETHRVADASKPLRRRKGTFRFSPTQTYRMHLQDAKTIPHAVAARQELRRRIDSGEFEPAGAEEQEPAEGTRPAGGHPGGSHTLKEAIVGYQAERDAPNTFEPGLSFAFGLC